MSVPFASSSELEHRPHNKIVCIRKRARGEGMSVRSLDPNLRNGMGSGTVFEGRRCCHVYPIATAQSRAFCTTLARISALPRPHAERGM